MKRQAEPENVQEIVLSNEKEMYDIRQATVNDAEEIARIWNNGVVDAFGFAAPADIDAFSFFNDRLAKQNDVFRYWVAHESNSILGWCSLQPCRNNPLAENKRGEISTYVTSRHIDHGVARTLIEVLISHAAAAGINYIVGHARGGNSRILGLLDSLGWVQVGIIPSRSATGRTEPLVYLGRVVG